MAMPSWVPPIETKPAPMPLLLVQSFVNTWEGDTGIDLLADRASAESWLREAGLLQGSLGEEQRVGTQRMREAIRALLVHKAGGPAPDASDLHVLSSVAAGCSLRPLIASDGTIELAPAERPDGSPHLARLLLIIHDAQREGTWARLKACRNADCRWAYFDRSHAGRGAWCDMAVCGNRIKNRNLRSRRSHERSAKTGQTERPRRS
jgi:predicted RNA-binding Zn ribbon-like protein